MAPLAGAFGGLLASGILKLDHFGATRSWRMIFAIEGIMTIVISIVALFALTDRPATARWLTQEEKDLAVARVKAERIGATEVLDGIDAAKLSKGIFSPVTLATGSIFLLNNITVQGLAVFAPTIVATIYPNSSTISKQLHTVPPYIAGAFVTVIVPYFSWRFDRRTIFLIFTAPFAVVGYIMFVASTNPQLRYGALFVIAMGPFSSGALCNAIVSANVVSDTARSAAISTNVMLGSLGGLISTWSFLPFDAPNYPIGNRLNLATSLASLLGSIGLLAWMKRNNKTRDMCDAGQRLAGLKEKEIQDLDWSHPSFRWHL
jgi:sugar phosphate permease